VIAFRRLNNDDDHRALSFNGLVYFVCFDSVSPLCIPILPILYNHPVNLHGKTSWWRTHLYIIVFCSFFFVFVCFEEFRCGDWLWRSSVGLSNTVQVIAAI